MKPGVRIINCARGGLIVEEDLKAALDSGHVAGAALDVFAVEPAKQHILFGRENLVVHGRGARTEPTVTVATLLPKDSPQSLLARLYSDARRVAS